MGPKIWSKPGEPEQLRVAVQGAADHTTPRSGGKCELFSGRSTGDMQEMRGCND